MPLNTDDTLLHFTETGQGEVALIFLHYFAGFGSSWAAVTAELENDFHCIAIDLHGFGHSSATDKALSVDENADDVLNLIDTLDLTEYILIGHSMGGKIALAVAARQPAGLASLILVAPSPPTPEPMADNDRKDLANAFGNRLAISNLVKKITAKPLDEKIITDIVEDQLLASHTAWNGWVEEGSKEDISLMMPNINVPITVISGAEDPNFPSSFLKNEFSKYFPNASFIEIAETGHLIPIEVSVELANAIKTQIEHGLSEINGFGT